MICFYFCSSRTLLSSWIATLVIKFVSLSAKCSWQMCVCVCVLMSPSSLPMIIAEVTSCVSNSDRERMWKLRIYVCVCVVLEPGFVCLRIRQLQPLPWAPTPDLLKHPLLYLLGGWEMAIDAPSQNAHMQMNWAGWGVTVTAPPLSCIYCIIQCMCILIVRVAFK